MHVCSSVYLSVHTNNNVCLTACPFDCLSFWLSVILAVCLSGYLPFWLSVFPTVSLTDWLFD
jgi:hypothetical protein